MSVTDRAKHQVARYGQTVSVVFLLVGVVAVTAGGYVYLTPGVEQVPPEQQDVQEFETSVEHSAVVVNDTRLYNATDRLRNQPRYFFNSTPILTLSTVAQVPDDRRVAVSHHLVVDVRATADDRVFFERTEVLANESTVVQDGEFVTNTTLNASRLVAEVDEVRTQVGGLGTVSTQLRLETTYETASQSQQGDTYEGTLRSNSTLRLADRGYWLDENLSASTSESTTVPREPVRQEPNVLLVGGLEALGIVCLVLAGAFRHWSSRRVDLTELKMRIDRSQYSEWISEGDFPVGQDKQYVYIESLEDLVDVAIDTNKRVIYDPQIETYAVADSDMVYYHATDPRAVSSWIDLS